MEQIFYVFVLLKTINFNKGNKMKNLIYVTITTLIMLTNFNTNAQSNDQLSNNEFIERGVLLIGATLEFMSLKEKMPSWKVNAVIDTVSKTDDNNLLFVAAACTLEIKEYSSYCEQTVDIIYAASVYSEPNEALCNIRQKISNDINTDLNCKSY